MFDFAWSEIAIIGVVALIAIGPKDMPVAIRAVTNAVKKARKMAGEFQTHVDEMVREANLDEVKNQINEIRNFDLKDTLEKAVDADGTLRNAFSDPLSNAFGTSGTTAEAAPAAPVLRWEPPAPPPPAFIPPGIAEPPPPPAFIPPDAVRR